MHVAIEQPEQIAELLLGDEGCLRACPHVQPMIVTPPGDRAVRLQMHVLHTRGRVGLLVDDVRLFEALLDAAELAVDVDIDVVVKRDAPIVQDRRPGRHGRLRIEYRGKKLVIDREQPARFFRGALGFSHNGCNALPDETNDIVQNVGIVGIDEVILVRRRAVEPARHVLPSEYGDDAGNRRGLIPLDGLDARMRMRRAQHLEMQHALHRRQIERVLRAGPLRSPRRTDFSGSLRTPGLRCPLRRT